MSGQRTVLQLRQAIAPILSTIQDQLYELEIKVDGDTLTVPFKSTPNHVGGNMFGLRVAGHRILIDTIIKPENIHQRGLGRSLIAATRDVATEFGYRLFIVGMVPGFYRKSLEWGAIEISDEDVEITNSTRLVDVLPGQSTFKALDSELLPEESVTAGHERFLVDYPDVVAGLLPADLAETFGIDIIAERAKLIDSAIFTLARKKGVEAFEVLLEYAIELPSERERILERRREIIRTRSAQ